MPDLALTEAPRSRRLTLPDDAFIEARCADIRRGIPARVAFVAEGIPEATFYQWLAAAQNGHWPNGENVEPATRLALARLRDQIERAQAEWERTASETLAMVGRMPAGSMEWRAHFEHLKHNEATRARWREHRELRITQDGSVSHEHRIVRGLTDSDLAAALPVEWRELLPEATVVQTGDVPSG